MTERTSEKLTIIKMAIAAAARQAEREPSDVCLIAVSKTHSAETIRPLLAAGQQHFGENRIQEAAAKWPSLRAEFDAITLHFIGRLQSNKAAEAVVLFDVIHSLDRASLITAIARASDSAERLPKLLVQVNIGEEQQKGGCAIERLPTLLKEARDAGLTIAGLMAIPPVQTHPAPYFARLDELAAHYNLAWRSMGMSADYVSAVRLGATHVRIGTALFGRRPPAC